MAATLRDMTFTSLQAYQDVWIWSAGTHYDMEQVYVDDILVFAKEPKVTMDKLGRLYDLKPDVYFGANMEKVFNCQMAKWGGPWAARCMSRMQSELLKC